MATVSFMKTINFPYIALALSAFFFLLVMKGSELNSDGTTLLPLLTLLVVCEFSFFITAIATYIGFKNSHSFGLKSIYSLTTCLCLLFSIRFMLLGIELWPL